MNERLVKLEQHLKGTIEIKQENSNSKSKFVIRPLEKSDFEKGFPFVLSGLTEVGNVTREQFEERFISMEKCKDTYFVQVIEEIERKKIVGSATLMIEQKFIRNCGLCGHIEDVVIDSEQRGHNLGKLLIESLKQLAIQKKCYKIILDCSEKNVPFYEKCGFTNTEIMMRYPPKK